MKHNQRLGGVSEVPQTERQSGSEPVVSSSVGRGGTLFHTTARHNLPSICEEGIRPVGGEHRSHLAKQLAMTASEHGYEYPIDRQKCVFFYPALTEAVWTMRSAAEARTAGLGSDVKGVVVVDIDRIENDLFVGDFKLFSDIIDFQHRATPDETMVTESCDDALCEYLETLTPMTADDDFDELCERAHLPEILVEGGVTPDAIVEVRTLKRIFGLSGTKEPHESFSLFERGR